MEDSIKSVNLIVVIKILHKDWGGKKKDKCFLDILGLIVSKSTKGSYNDPKMFAVFETSASVSASNSPVFSLFPNIL